MPERCDVQCDLHKVLMLRVQKLGCNNVLDACVVLPVLMLTW